MELFFDTETTGLPLYKEHWGDHRQPHTIQLGAILSDKYYMYNRVGCLVVPPFQDWEIHPKAEEVHGISKDMILKNGIGSKAIGLLFLSMLECADTVVCHNKNFDVPRVIKMLYDAGLHYKALEEKQSYCTMLEGTNICKLPGRYGKYKWPKLVELHRHFFNEEFSGAHDALADVEATRRCYYEMVKSPA